MIDYSFIIPHKNTPDLLRKCIDSIPHREGVQIIVVDDNSDPGKVDFDHFPGVGEPFTEVYLTKEGRGAGYARNVGLSHAVGKWIVFADADDYFNPCIEQAMEEKLFSEVDVIFFKGTAIKLHGGESSDRGAFFNELVDRAIITSDFSELLFVSTPYKKFINRAFLTKNKINFNECRWGNDVVFSARIAARAKSFDASIYQIYCITESDGSLIKNTSIEAQKVRLIQECGAVSLLRKSFPRDKRILESLFTNWFDLYKKTKFMAIVLIPRTLCAGGFQYLKLMFNKCVN